MSSSPTLAAGSLLDDVDKLLRTSLVLVDIGVLAGLDSFMLKR